MIREPFDRFDDGTVAAGQEALRHRMRGIIYQSSQGRLDQPRLTQFERLVMGEPDEVTAVNREIVAHCRQKTAEIEAAWRDPQRRHPAKEVCQYQTELVPFAVGEGELRTRDARLKTKPGETAWLLSAAPSKTYVAYQPQPHAQLPLALDTPIARIESERFPFGKLVASLDPSGTLTLDIDAGFRPFWSAADWRAQVWQGLATYPSDILIHTRAPKVSAVINGDPMPVVQQQRDGNSWWVLDPYARLPRVRDRVRTNRPSP